MWAYVRDEELAVLCDDLRAGSNSLELRGGCLSGHNNRSCDTHKGDCDKGQEESFIHFVDWSGWFDNFSLFNRLSSLLNLSSRIKRLSWLLLFIPSRYKRNILDSLISLSTPVSMRTNTRYLSNSCHFHTSYHLSLRLSNLHLVYKIKYLKQVDLSSPKVSLRVLIGDHMNHLEFSLRNNNECMYVYSTDRKSINRSRIKSSIR